MTDPIREFERVPLFRRRGESIWIAARAIASVHPIGRDEELCGIEVSTGSYHVVRTPFSYVLEWWKRVLEEGA